VTVVLVIQPAVLVRHIVICGLPGSTVRFHIIVQTARISKNVIGNKIYVWVFSTISFETFLILRRTEQDMEKSTSIFL